MSLDFAHDMTSVASLVGLEPWERELLERPAPSIAIDGYDAVNEDADERAISELIKPATTYKVVDLALRETLTGGLSLNDAHRLVDFLKREHPQIRLDIRTEF